MKKPEAKKLTTQNFTLPETITGKECIKQLSDFQTAWNELVDNTPQTPKNLRMLKETAIEGLKAINGFEGWFKKEVDRLKQEGKITN